MLSHALYVIIFGIVQLVSFFLLLFPLLKLCWNHQWTDEDIFLFQINYCFGLINAIVFCIIYFSQPNFTYCYLEALKHRLSCKKRGKLIIIPTRDNLCFQIRKKLVLDLVSSILYGLIEIRKIKEKNRENCFEKMCRDIQIHSFHEENTPVFFPSQTT